MRTEINNEQLDQVTGGSVRLNTTKMMIGFSVLQQTYGKRQAVRDNGIRDGVSARFTDCELVLPARIYCTCHIIYFLS